MTSQQKLNCNRLSSLCLRFCSFRPLTTCALFISSVLATSAQALDYGVYDSRSLAMGGAGVASANTQNAVFYNPALLSMYEGQEEDTRNGRVYLPIGVGQLSESVQDTLDVVDDDLDDQLSMAVAAYNADPSTENTNALLSAATALRNGITLIGNRELSGDLFVGMMVSEPSHREGGSFYFGTRVVAGGNSTVTQEDLDLLDDYIALAQGQDRPNLRDADDNLIDPADQVTSFADINSLAITEWGVGVSKEFRFWRQPVAIGLTPKIMRVDVYQEQLTYADADYDYADDKRSHLVMNTDLGIALPLGRHFRVALAAKDIIPQKFSGASGEEIETSARARLAAAYAHKYLTLAVDVDLQKNDAFTAGMPSQEMAVGMEVSLIPWVHFRGGYRQDLEGVREDILSAGVGFRTGRFVADLAYAYSEDITGAGVQLGWTF